MAFSFGGLEYKWKRKGLAKLPSEATTSLKLDEQNVIVYSVLSINKTSVTHEGWYCCVATNECGDVEECAWLEVNSESLLVANYSLILFINVSIQPQSDNPYVCLGFGYTTSGMLIATCPASQSLLCPVYY